jgi:hypothetical protein
LLGSPDGIRTRALRLERAASSARLDHRAMLTADEVVSLPGLGCLDSNQD